jgi:SAM-dependent methyltransferase
MIASLLVASGCLAMRHAAALCAACAFLSPAFAQPAPKPESVAPSIYTPAGIVDEIMQLARVGPGDYVVDLGSGDGRMVIAAVAKYKARGGFGVDISPMMITLSNQNAAKAGVADRVSFYERDLFATDVSEATVVTVYLLPSIMGKVEKKLLAELRPGTRVVVHDFPFPSWKADKVIAVDSPEKIATTGLAFTQLYVYTVPATR